MDVADFEEALTVLFNDYVLDLSGESISEYLVTIGGDGEISEDKLENKSEGRIGIPAPRPVYPKKVAERVKSVINKILNIIFS